MAKLQTNLSLSEDTRTKADQIMIVRRSASGQNITRSELVTELVDQAYASLKRIEAHREGSKTVGWDMFYGDFHVGYVDGVGNKAQAQSQLDSWVREELSK